MIRDLLIFKKLSVVLSLLLFSIFYFSVSAQEGKVILDGSVKDGKTKLSGAQVKVMQNGSELKSISTATNGKFNIELLLGKNYNIVFSK